MQVPEYLLYLTDEDVSSTLSIAEAVDLAEKGIQADAAGQVAGDKFYMPVAGAGFIKPFSGYLVGEELAFVKTFSFFQRNPEQYGCPATSSMVLLFDAHTGLPVCIMEGQWVTALKTGASTAITTAHLAHPDARRVVVFGAGALGKMHLHALSHRLDLDGAYVVDIRPSAAEDYARDLETELGFPIQPVPLDERERAVRDSDIVFTVTTGSMPLVQREWLRPGAFVARLGSFQELALDVILGADKVIVDNWHYVSPRIPELIELARDGRFGEADVHAEWPDVVAGRKPGRQSLDEVIVYVALGIWGEYAAILPEVYRRARMIGLGRQLPLSSPRGGNRSQDD